MVPGLGGHSDCLDYFFKMIILSGSYEQLSHENENQCNKIKHF